MTSPSDWKAKLKALDPCPEAYRWAIRHKTLKEAWRMCERGDWMDWLLWACDVTTEGDPQVFGAIGASWEGGIIPGPEFALQDAYIILDFMPDPPTLPDV